MMGLSEDYFFNPRTFQGKAKNGRLQILPYYLRLILTFSCNPPFEIVPTPKSISTQHQPSAKKTKILMLN